MPIEPMPSVSGPEVDRLPADPETLITETAKQAMGVALESIARVRREAEANSSALRIG